MNKNTKISLSRFRELVSNEWLDKQEFPILLTRGAGNAKQVKYILTRAPLDPPLRLKADRKAKILGASSDGSTRSV
jgi:hypothetical protein